MDHKCSIEPLLAIEGLDTKIPEPLSRSSFNAIILTSVNALPALNRKWSSLNRSKIPLLTTGAVTQDAAREIGFINSRSVDGSALKLVEKIPGWLADNNISSSSNLLYPAAEKRAHNLVKILQAQPGGSIINCTVWPTYRAVPLKEFSKTTKSALQNQEIDAVLLYSPRTAETFVSLWEKLPNKPQPPDFFALSANICTILQKNQRFECQFPKIPNEKHLFNLL